MGNIRIADATDDDVVSELLIKSFSHLYATMGVDMSSDRRAYLRDQAGRRVFAETYVYELDGVATGTVTLVPPSVHCEAWIKDAWDLRLLAVDPLMQKRGIARELVVNAEHKAKAAGATTMCLHARRGVPQQACFYLACGYLRDTTGDLDVQPFQEGYRKIL